MTKFLKLTRNNTEEVMLVSITSIRMITKNACGGSRIYFSDDPKYGQTVVNERVEVITKMIEQEEVVK